MEDTSAKRRIRGKNYSQTEVEVLVEEVFQKRNVLFGPIRGPMSHLTQSHRDKTWQQVASAVNFVAPVVRKVEELKKKFKDIKNRTRLKAIARKKGGGENDAPPLSTVEEKILQFLAERENSEPINGGIDTYRPKVTNSPPSPNPSTSQSEIEVLDLASLPPPPEFTDAIKFEFFQASSLEAPPAKEPAKAPRKKRNAKSAAIAELAQQTKTLEDIAATVSRFEATCSGFFKDYLELKRREVELLQEKVHAAKKIKIEDDFY